MNQRFSALLFSAFVVTATAQTEIYNENFESGAPVDYTIVDNDGLTPESTVSEFTDAWIRLADPGNTTDTVMGSTSYFDPTGTADRWLISPAITLGTFGNYLYWEARSHDPSFPDNYYVLISKTDTELSSFTDTVGIIFQEYASWTSRDVNLTGYGLDNETIYVAFVNRTSDGFKLYIDDIRVETENSASVDKLTGPSISVYPNPVSDVLYITSEVPVESVSIFNLSGQIVQQVNGLSTVTLEHLRAGTYVVQVKTTQSVHRQQITKY